MCVSAGEKGNRHNSGCVWESADGRYRLKVKRQGPSSDFRRQNRAPGSQRKDSPGARSVLFLAYIGVGHTEDVLKTCF